MITFQREKLTYKLYEELLPLLKESNEEVYYPKENKTLAKSLQLSNINNSSVNYKFFQEKENMGFLNICTMREKGKLIGHWSCVLNYHAQSKELLVADTQNIHVLKEYRGLNSIKFMKFTQEILKKRGVKLLNMAINPQLNQQKLMDYLGFSIDEIIYSKGL